MKNLPEKIYLQIGDMPIMDLQRLDWNDLGEVSWSPERVYPSDIECIVNPMYGCATCDSTAPLRYLRTCPECGVEPLCPFCIDAEYHDCESEADDAD